jgi:hypothetical protein
MTDKELISKLNKAASLLNEVHKEAASKYKHGFIFFDESGYFHLMEGDDEEGQKIEGKDDRQDYVVLSSAVRATVTAGAW